MTEMLVPQRGRWPGPTTLTPAEVAEMVARRRRGYTLEAPFYTSREIYDLDVELIFGRHWIFVAVEPEIPEEGDYVTVDIGPQSVIVMRDDDGEVRAFHNVCRHRGARLLEDRCGGVGNIVCPYHQWTYGTDGSLRFAESQGERFDKRAFGLRPVHARSLSGLIFICLAEEPPADIEELAGLAEQYLGAFDLTATKVAHQTHLVEDGNWKITMENNRECHHCEVNHPELLGAYFPFSRYDDGMVPPRQRPLFESFQTAMSDLEDVRGAMGFPPARRRELDTRITGYMFDHLPLVGDGASYGADGGPLCTRLLGGIPRARFGDSHLHTQPNAWFHFLSDHAVVFSVLPVAPDKTLVRSTWLVHPDAIEGVDYTIADLTAVWEATNREDRDLVERTQRGVTDPAYLPGPYAVVEDDVEAFVAWYIGRLGAELGASG